MVLCGKIIQIFKKEIVIATRTTHTIRMRAANFIDLTSLPVKTRNSIHSFGFVDFFSLWYTDERGCLSNIANKHCHSILLIFFLVFCSLENRIRLPIWGKGWPFCKFLFYYRIFFVRKKKINFIYWKDVDFIGRNQRSNWKWQVSCDFLVLAFKIRTMNCRNQVCFVPISKFSYAIVVHCRKKQRNQIFQRQIST